MAKGNRISRKRAVGLFCAIVLVSAVIVVTLAPYIWMLLMSFRTRRDIRMNPGRFLPAKWVLSGYTTVLTKAPFFSWLRNSLIVTFTVTCAVLFTSSIAGYVFAKFRFRGKTALFWILIATMMAPSQVSLIPSFLIINALGLYNTLHALIIPMLVSAFGIFLCRQFCGDIPDSLCEAAWIDGASSFCIYARVIVPLLRPCLAALAIFAFLASWNEYLMPLIMIEQTKNMTLPVALSYFTGAHANDTGAVLAAAALITLPVTALFLALQKQFVKGITLTGMK